MDELTTEQKRLAHIAYHEAGHVVAAMVLHTPVEFAEITYMDGISGGAAAVHNVRLQYRLLTGKIINESTRQKAKRELLIDLAGIAAEDIFFGEASLSSKDGDMVTVVDAALKLSKGDPQKYIYKVMREVTGILKSHKAQVASIAQRLLEGDRVMREELEELYSKGES